MKNESGPQGEEFIAQLLKKKGYQILARNYKTRFGEIDIVAGNKKYLLFVEVKTRSVTSIGTPMEAVTPAKQRKVILAAEEYLQQWGGSRQPRFDAAAVYTDGKKVCSWDYLEDAFRP